MIKEKQELQRKLDESEKLAKKEKEAKEKLKKQFEDLDKQNKAYTEQIDQLKEDIESAVTNGNQEEVAGLEASLKDKESELKASIDKIKDLEKQLKNKPIEVPAVVEKVPPDVEKELAELRKLAQQNDKSVVKFSVAFEALVKNFGDLLGSLNNIQDPAEQERYRNAVGALIDKMKERL
jgi:chromosome segregation ATPase